MPNVSVILPTHNRAHILARAIRSVLAQTYVDLELIVVDDGSTDETESVVNAFSDPRLIYIKHDDCCGAAVARNTGIKASSAPWLAFQDSDDMWRIDKLGCQLSLLNDAPDVGLICCGYVAMSRSGKARYVGADTRMQNGDWGADNIYDFCFITPTWLLRREVFDSCGGFDESLPNLEDWELAFRLYQLTTIRVIKEPLVVKYGSADSLYLNRHARKVSLEAIIRRHKSIWAGQPKILAKLHAELGQLQCLSGNSWEGRRQLYTAIKLNRYSYKYWAKWGVSLLGSRMYRRILRVSF